MSAAKKTIILWGPEQMETLRQELSGWRQRAEEGRAIALTLSEAKRSLEQNALMWVILTAWARQKEWQVNGKATFLTPEDWKDILTAAYLREVGRIAPGLEGGMVLLGCRTRDFTVKEMAEFLTWLLAASDAHQIELPPAAVDYEPQGYTRSA